MSMQEIFIDRQRRKFLGTRAARMKLWSFLALGGFVLLVLGVLGVGMLFAWYAKDLPRPDRVQRRDGLSTVVLDRNGEKLYDIFDEANRIPATWDEIPQYLKDATIAIEDKDFYRHQGLSTAGIARGLLACFILHRCQGGSTLTQQLVKNELLSNERTLPRKMKEAILAIQIERKYSKNDILRMYLNAAPYGGTAVGVITGSEHYFGKKVSELTLVESAVLAGFPQAPSVYSPFTGEVDAYKGRASNVLRRMREDGYITPAQEAEARTQLDSLSFAGGDSFLRAPHFVSYIKELLLEKFGEKTVNAGGLIVTTTLDWKLQEEAQKAVKEEVDKAKKLSVSNGAAIVMDPLTGEILSMVGSRDYAATDSSGLKFNVVTQGLRQPGSALKPIIYAAALARGHSASTMLMDVETKYPSGETGKPDYNPKNYDGKYRGPTQLRYALANSVNTIAVKIAALVGVKEILRFGHAMGLKTWEPTDAMVKRVGLSLPLGGAEVYLIDIATAYSVFASGGKRTEPVALLKVVDTNGKILFEHKSPSPKQELEPEIAYIISSILSDNDARAQVFGTRSHLVIPGKTVAAKTGTTDDKRDNWTAGYTPRRVVVTWVGNNDNTPMSPSLASGVTGAAPIWNRIMKAALVDLSDMPFDRPNGVRELEIDALGGGLPYEGQPTRREFFVSGTEPTQPSAIYQKLKISRKDNSKLANSVEVATGDYEEKFFIVIHEDDPVSGDGKNRWQEGINTWIAGQDSKFRPPTEVYSGGNSDQLVISIKTPSDNSQVGNDVTIEAEAISTADIERIEIFVDGDKKRERSDKKINETINIANGSHVIKVKATDKRGKSAEREIKIGVNEPYSTPTP